jgi:hypothetical protein
VHAGHEHFPFVAAPKIVGHEEAAAQEVIAHLGGLRVGEIPFAGTHRVEPGPIEHVVALVEVHGLLHRTRVNPRETPHGLKKMAIGAWIILGPTGVSLGPIFSGAIEAGVGRGRIHQAGEDEFGFLLVVGWKRKIVVLNGWEFAKRHLESAQRSGQSNRSATQRETLQIHSSPQIHIQRIPPAGRGAGV